MSIKETIPFSFDDIYDYISEKFSDAGYDAEEGSNTMQLVTAMSYLVSMLNANTAVNINETLLTLARKRNMILQDARLLGYEIEHIQSYKYTIDILFSEIGTYRINKYEEFTAGDYSYYYMGDTIENIVVTQDDIDGPDGGIIQSIEVIEGVLKKYDNEDTLSVVIQDIYDEDAEEWGTQHYVDIPFTDVEENSIEVFLTYYDEDANFYDNEEWTKSDQFMIDADTVLNKQFVRLDNIEYRTPRIYFKLGDVGQELRSGTIINMNIIVSSGTSGAMTEMPSTSLTGEVIDYTLNIQGTAEEDTDSIKLNAPKFHNSANRAVTETDYTAIAGRQSSVNFCKVWDGNVEYPKIAGHIWFSFIPSALTRDINDDDNPGYTWEMKNTFDITNWFIEDDEFENVFTVFDQYKIPTLEFHNRHPFYMDFSYNVKVARYSVKTSESDINEGMFDVINNFFRDDDDIDETAMESFEFEYFQSNLVKRLDAELTDIMGFDLYLTTSITLLPVHIHENVLDENYSDIKFHLGIPFEGIFDIDGEVILENIPNIDTENFISTKKLYVDTSTYVRDEDTEISTIDIKLTDATGVEVPLSDDVIGTYKIFNDINEDIEIHLFVITGTGYTVGIDPTDLDIVYDGEDIDEDNSGATMIIEYPTTNIPFIRNTIPRLKTVDFI